MKQARTRIVCWLVFLAAGSLPFGQESRADEAKTVADQPPKVDFVKDVRPILQNHCVSCHGPAKQRGGLRLDERAAAFKGGDSGPAFQAGKSATSLLLHRAESTETKERMPPKGERLTAEQIDLIRAWIAQGAAWPETGSTNSAANHWAFIPVSRPLEPKTAAARVRNPIDSFILEKLEKQGLKPAAAADRPTLMRRLKFDVLGLPPTPEEMAAFVTDQDPEAYEKLVDRYLAAPQFGERWARHWLDVVRFAESDGFETNLLRPNAWPYRDWVIRSLNDDKPYDRFVFEQLAGDTLGVDEATGFIVGGTRDLVKSPDEVLTLQQRADELHDMVSTTGSAFLGLTVGCARCHNHKFDPISQVDYYALKAMFAGVQHGDRPQRSADSDGRQQELQQVRQQLARVDNSIEQLGALAQLGRTLVLDGTSPAPGVDTGAVHLLVPPTGTRAYQQGTAKGQINDRGDGNRFPNLSDHYSYWEKPGDRDVVSWEPNVSGRFRVWLSWGCGVQTHAPAARYFLDTDGSRVEIARVDQRKFADNAGDIPGQPLWSGFFDAGVHSLKPGSRIVLNGDTTAPSVTADLVLLQEQLSAETGKAVSGMPHLRPAVRRLTNVERFTPVAAKFVRMTISATTQLEPCIDELEVFSAGDRPRNVALASNGTRATASSTLPGFDIHRLEFIHDGRYGNSWSWISNERGKGWVQLEFPEPTLIDRIVWSRDRQEADRYNDRTATHYRFEVAVKPGEWQVVASSDDRLPQRFKTRNLSTAAGLGPNDQVALGRLVAQKKTLETKQQTLATGPLVYAGQFTSCPTTFRLHRGDPTMRREPVAPAGLASFGKHLQLALDAPEDQRRLALAQWIIDPKHPLTARVVVNRLWHYHFGTGIVATPSDLGINGARPSHPELLDWLADEMTTHGWRMKHVHRLILLSNTYRQASATNPKGLAADADARLLWRYPPRRLEAEPLRDAMLAVSGKLDARQGGPGFDLFLPNSSYVKVYTPKTEFGPAEWRRMIYQSKPRMQLDDTFGAFDCPDAGQIAPKRNSSLTALQAVNLLNSPFALQQTQFFADRLKHDAGPEPSAQVLRGFQLAFQRAPSELESTAAVDLIRTHGLPAFCRALFNANEFLFIF